MDIIEKINYWIELSDEDLITAEIILKSERFLHFGFLCHLSVEKILKAYFWYSKQTEPPYTHSLLVLSSKSSLSGLLNDNYKQLLYKLMPLNIEARYPSNKNEIYKLLTKEYCYNLLSETKEFLQWIKTLLIK